MDNQPEESAGLPSSVEELTELARRLKTDNSAQREEIKRLNEYLTDAKKRLEEATNQSKELAAVIKELKSQNLEQYEEIVKLKARMSSGDSTAEGGAEPVETGTRNPTKATPSPHISAADLPDASKKDRGQTAVVIDDSKLMHASLRSIVEPMGYTVLGCASNGLEGTKMVVTLQPSLVLLDYDMPLMNGLKTASEIRKRDSDVRIIMISGVIDSEDDIGAYDMDATETLKKAGVDAFLIKPVNPKKFKAVLERIYGTD